MARVSTRPVALLTGVGRTAGIGATLATRLLGDGWDVAFTYWTPYDVRMPWGPDTTTPDVIAEAAAAAGGASLAIEADLSDPATPAAVLDEAEALGPVTALVAAHCESVDSSILDTTVESFDRHFAVNTRATWLLIREFALRYRGAHGAGRVIALTSDHTVHNVPYGASKGALDRITIAAAHELAHLGITANVVDPGPVDTGWMSEEVRERCLAATPLGRLGTPEDTADLVAFLCSARGGWMNGKHLASDGGFR
jgi:3-oxoacyl-[acyl-carrier protein] reductase